MESGAKLYDDMVLAYQNGAKYILVFDANEGWTENVLMQEHLDAMQKFWTYAQNNPRPQNTASQRTAAVLPEDYAYSFRGPSDRIWGLWSPDDLTVNISSSVLSLLETYGGSLDLIYPSSDQDNVGYRDVIEWNSSVGSQSFSSYDNTLFVVAVALGVVAMFVAAVVAVVKFSNKSADQVM